MNPFETATVAKKPPGEAIILLAAVSEAIAVTGVAPIGCAPLQHPVPGQGEGGEG
jgi:hypothetical protein